jgi:hypothetical protein
MMSQGVLDLSTSLEEKTSMLNELYRQYEQSYLGFSSDSIAYWVSYTVARIVMSKMTLIVFLPVLFASSDEEVSESLRTKLLIAAMEVAEYNDALNSEPAAKPWKWICQTYTHWHAIVYLLLEVSRREWSPTVERAWVALHSKWLIPEKKSRNAVWIPLRKLMAKARKHRESEIQRLKSDSQTATKLEAQDRNTPLPTSSGQFPKDSVVELFRERWRQLVGLSEGIDFGDNAHSTSNFADNGLADGHYTSPMGFNSDMNAFQTAIVPDSGFQHNNNLRAHISPFNPRLSHPNHDTMNAASQFGTLHTSEPNFDHFSSLPAGMIAGPSLDPWLWADVDPAIDMSMGMDMDQLDVNSDLDVGMNWYSWVESAKAM